MAKEVLAISEDDLSFVVAVLRRGISETNPKNTIESQILEDLTSWCLEEENYLRRLAGTDETSVKE